MSTFLHYVPVIAVLLVFVERMREVAKRRKIIPGKRKETLTFNLFMVCGMAMTLGSILEYVAGGLDVSPVLFGLGVACSVASFSLRRTAIQALGRFWSLHVEMREGHEFVKSGPFRWMRHPVYFSMILELLGLALLTNAWITYGVVMLIFVPTMVRRLHLEESALLEQFGTAYEGYQATTPLLIPWRFPPRR